MHVADPRSGILGANAIVGASMPLAVGAGLSSKLLGQGRVAVAFFGEGAVNQGTFHEALNLAAIWDLPVVFVCENNVYAEFTDSRTMTRVPRVAERAAGLRGRRRASSTATTSRRCTRPRSTPPRAAAPATGPFLIEAETYRWHGHYEGDAQPYKPEDESAAWRDARPARASPAARLVERGDATEERARASPRRGRAQRVEAAVERARALPAPALEEAYAACLRRLRPRPQSRATSTRSTRGMADAIEEDERVVLIGIDVGAGGGIFTVTKGLHERFGAERVIDTPISEMGYVGAAVGAAMTGPAADRRDHVHGLRRRLPGPDPQPGGEAAAT